MTNEERAIKWLENVPEAKNLSLEERMTICSRVAKGTAAVFFGILAAECIALYLVSGGAVFDWVAGIINRFAENSHGTRQYELLALFGVIFYLPLFVLPIVAGVIYQRKKLRNLARQISSASTEKLMTDMSQTNISQSDRNKSTEMENTTSDTEEAWLNHWKQIKQRFDCKIDLESYFRSKKIGEADLDVLDLGRVHFPTGRVVACDPFVGLDEAMPYIQTIPAGNYPVKIAVSDSNYGIRYACVKVEISKEKPVRYELAMTGKEKLDQAFDEGDFFGFGVDAGMACIADRATQKAFRSYWQKLASQDDSIDPFNDLFSDLLVESYKKNPRYQSEYGDWLNWQVPGTNCDLPIFSSGWGDGLYPVYFGYDAAGKAVGIYIHFIDIETEFSEADAAEEALDSSEKQYSNWTMDVDGTEQAGFTMKAIEYQLEAIKNGDTEFMILTPSEPIQTKNRGYVCNFVQFARDENPDYYHCEVSITSAGKVDGTLIYGKDRFHKKEVVELIRGLLDSGIAPDTKDWEMILDLRPEKEDISSEKDSAPYRRIAALVIEDPESLSKLEICFRSPQKYFNENAERYEERFFEGDQPDGQIIWVGIADEMIAGGTAIELDWKTEKEEFLEQMKALTDKHYLALSADWLKEEGDIPAWCSVLDEKWSEQEFCVAAMDIDSDSYVLFVCRSVVLTQLITLGKEIRHRFDFAKNM